MKGGLRLQVILASHSQMAKGLKKTVELIMGKQPNLHAIEAYDDNQEPLKKQLKDQLTKNDHEKYVFITDIIGGSVNTTIAQMIAERDEMFLVTGMNLPLVLAVLTTELDNCSSQQILSKLDQLCKEARQELKVVQLLVNETEDF